MRVAGSALCAETHSGLVFAVAELDNKRQMLDIHKNPLLVSILYSCELLKALDAKNELPLKHLKHAKGLMFFKADKVPLHRHLQGGQLQFFGSPQRTLHRVCSSNQQQPTAACSGSHAERNIDAALEHKPG